MPATPVNTRVRLRTTSRRVPRATADAVDTSPEPTVRLSRAIVVMLLLHVVAVGGFFASSVLKEKDSKRDRSEVSRPLEAEDSQIPSKGSSTNSTKRLSSSPNGSVPRTHVVRPGETLTLIANDNGVTLEALVAANGAETVTSGLRTGQELRLPEKSPDPTLNSTESTTETTKPLVERSNKTAIPFPANPSPAVNGSVRSAQVSTRSYVVLKGDNAHLIAQKNRVNYEALLKLNQIDDPGKIKPGQKLKLPPATTKLNGN